MPPWDLAFCQAINCVNLRFMKTVLLSLILLVSSTGFSSIDRRTEVISFLATKSPRLADPVEALAWEIRSQTTGNPISLKRLTLLSETVDESVEELLKKGTLAPLAWAAWTLQNQKSPLASPLVSLMESLVNSNGEIKKCRQRCDEVAALTYLLLLDHAPNLAKRVEAQLKLKP